MAMLAGCSGHGAGLEVLGREPAGGDLVPAEVAAAGGLEEGTTRLLAEADGKAYYVSEIAGPAHDLCLSLLAGEDKAEPVDWTHGCSAGIPLTVERSGVRAQLVPDGFDASSLIEQGWRQLHPNLLVQTT
jgi:hypothetical protein